MDNKLFYEILTDEQKEKLSNKLAQKIEAQIDDLEIVNISETINSELETALPEIISERLWDELDLTPFFERVTKALVDNIK